MREPNGPKVPPIRIGIKFGVSYREVRLQQPVITIGRAVPDEEMPTVDLSEDDSVSRRHAEIRWTDGGYVIADFGSKNGTWVNGQRIDPNQPVRLRDGDRVAVGRLSLLAINLPGSGHADPAAAP